MSFDRLAAGCSWATRDSAGRQRLLLIEARCAAAAASSQQHDTVCANRAQSVGTLCLWSLRLSTAHCSATCHRRAVRYCSCRKR